MNQNSKKIFVDSYETTVMYYVYLHLGYFYSCLSKHEDLSNKAKDVLGGSGTGRHSLRKDIIEKSLNDIYSKSQQSDIFFNLILNNSIRGITMALVGALNDKEIKKLFLEHIFINDGEACDNFDGIVRFIRNTFSHNIRDRIAVKRKEYEGQMKYLKREGKSTLNFFFDYAKSPIPITSEHCTVKIDVDFNQIKDGIVYTDIISDYQTFLFIELCYNCMEYLKNGVKHRLTV